MSIMLGIADTNSQKDGNCLIILQTLEMIYMKTIAGRFASSKDKENF
jgi:hypothetical protein